MALILIFSSFNSISTRACSRAGSSTSSEVTPPEPPPEADCSWSTLSSSNGAVKSFSFSAAEPAAAPIPLTASAASSAPEVSTLFIDVFNSLKEDAMKLSIILKAIIKPLTYAIALDRGATIKLPIALPNWDICSLKIRSWFAGVSIFRAKSPSSSEAFSESKLY